MTFAFVAPLTAAVASVFAGVVALPAAVASIASIGERRRSQQAQARDRRQR
jgi:hypothetical protein